MKKNTKLIFVIIAALVVGSVAYLSLNNGRGGAVSRTAGSKGKLSAGDVIGQKAPDFSLQDINGNTITLGDFEGKNVLLFFNEGEMCYPACWNQVEALGTDARFNSADTVAFSIVVDTKDQWRRIESQMPRFKNAKILFDTDRKVSLDYGVLSLASSMHPGSFPGHTYFLIDKNGVIKFFLDDPNMATRNDELAIEINKLNK